MKKRILALLPVLILCVGIAMPVTAAEGGQTGIEYGGKKVDGPGLVFDDVLFVPLRSVAESDGYIVQWSDADRQISVRKPGQEIVLKLDARKVSVSGHEYFLMIKVIEGRTYVSQDFITENLGLRIKRDKVKEIVSLTNIKLNPVTIKTKRMTSDIQNLSLNIQYPEIQGLSDTDIQKKFNGMFEKIALEAWERGIKNGNNISDEVVTRHIKAETFFNYHVKYNQNDILSVVFQDYQYTGGAHGLTMQSSYNFNLKTGEQYRLSYMFRDNADYVTLISREIKSQMAEKGITALLNPFNMIKPDHDFYISDEGIVVYFQQYELLPYAYGIPEFAIDSSLLAGSLQADIWLAE